LVFEVPQEPHFTQFDETTSHQRRVHLGELLELQAHGWVRRVPQGSQQCDYWEITDQGREVIPGTPGKPRRSAQRPGHEEGDASSSG
jgi:hypothetical protein